MALLMYKVVNGHAPKYLTQRFTKVKESNPYNLRKNELDIKLPLPKTEYMKKSIAYAGPTLWNALPSTLRSSDSLSVFKRNLKKCT